MSLPTNRMFRVQIDLDRLGRRLARRYDTSFPSDSVARWLAGRGFVRTAATNSPVTWLAGVHALIWLESDEILSEEGIANDDGDTGPVPLHTAQWSSPGS
jgi:hypothetical protein